MLKCSSLLKALCKSSFPIPQLHCNRPHIKSSLNVFVRKRPQKKSSLVFVRKRPPKKVIPRLRSNRQGIFEFPPSCHSTACFFICHSGLFFYLSQHGVSPPLSLRPVFLSVTPASFFYCHSGLFFYLSLRPVFYLSLRPPSRSPGQH